MPNSLFDSHCHRSLFACVIVATLVLAVSPSEISAGKMYWYNSFDDSIERANLDGLGRETLILGGTADAIALDVTAGKIYWAVREGRIERANLDGTGREIVIRGEISPERSIALDVAAGKMYWVSWDPIAANKVIARANLDGSGRERVLAVRDVAVIALDVAAGKMYWVTDFIEDTIGRANLDGSNPETLIAGLSGNGYSLALEVRAGKMYWTDGYDEISRANLDGSGREKVLPTGRPQGIALDLAAGKIYWTDSLANTVERANLDGSGRETLLAVGGRPLSIAVDIGGKMYWTDLFGRITRANLNGSDPAVLYRERVGATDIALHVAAGKIYWPFANYGAPGGIERSNLDGSGRETVIGGLPGPRGIALDAGARKMYWTDSFTSTIERANLDGSGRETVLAATPPLEGIALDAAAGKMYWWTGRDRIERANLDGSSHEIVLYASQPRSLALDVRAGKMYYLSYNYEWTTIERANLDGSERQRLIELGPSDEGQDIALDTEARKMYWTSYPAPDQDRGRIEWANLDGSERGILLSGVNFSPWNIALDLTTAHGVWFSSGWGGSSSDPVHDCVRLTRNTISTDRCGDAGPLGRLVLPEAPDFSLWIGQVPCQGLNLLFAGTSLEGRRSRTPVSSSAISGNRLNILGMAGFEVSACSAVPPAAAALWAGSPGETPAPGGQRDLLKPELGPAGSIQNVANKTYEVWFAKGSNAPPFSPSRDCLRFTATTLSTDLCAGTGTFVEWPLRNIPGMTVWAGQIVCQGRNTVYFGTSYDGTINFRGTKVISAVAGDRSGSTLALEGSENPSCATSR